MRKVLLLAVLVVALMAMPALASVQNIKVSGDIETTALIRDQFDLGDTTISNNYYQNLLITQTRLRVDADLTDNVSTTVRLINERAWNQESSSDTDIDLNLAYVTLREMLYSPLTVIIGRQEFAYGNSFVIDSAGTNNTISAGGLNGVAEDLSKRTALDAVRLVLDYNPLTIDLVAAKVDANTLAGAGLQDDDVDLFGINANYQLGDDMDTVVEGYFWAKIDQSTKRDNSVVGVYGDKAETVYMPGLRASANVLDGLNVQAELAWQMGDEIQVLVDPDTGADSKGNQIKRSAMAAQLMSTYKLPFEKTKEYNPVITSVYTYVSGDSGPSDGTNPANNDERYTAWDPMLENQSGGKIYNTLFNLTNCHVSSLKAQVNPIEDVTAIFEWTGLMLDKELKDTTSPDKGTSTLMTLYQPDQNNITPTMTSDKWLGNEFDFSLIYDYTEDVQFGASMGWFYPGPAFSSDNDQVASQWMLNAKAKF